MWLCRLVDGDQEADVDGESFRVGHFYSPFQSGLIPADSVPFCWPAYFRSAD